MAIACLHGDTDQSPTGRGKRTTNPHLVAVGSVCAPSPNCRAGTLPDSSALLQPLGSAVLDSAVMVVASLAHEPNHCPAPDRLALASRRLVHILEISSTRPLARRPSQTVRRGPRTDQTHGARELYLGRTTDPRRVAHAWLQSFTSHRIPLPRDGGPSSGTVVADISSQPTDCFLLPRRP